MNPVSFFCMLMSHCPSTTKGCLFSSMYFWHPCQKSGSCRCLGLCLGPGFCSIDLNFVFLQWWRTAFITMALQYNLKSDSAVSPALFFFSQECFDYLGFL